MTDNFQLAASILAAEQIIFGVGGGRFQTGYRGCDGAGRGW